MAQPGSSPMRIQSGLQCGDYVHPNTSGYAKMANSIDLSRSSGGAHAPPGVMRTAF